MTIQQLRNSGYKVRVLHHRLYNKHYAWQTGHSYDCVEPDSKGGSTQVIIDSPDGKHFIGEAICSKKENYNKKMGVRIALGRSGVFSK